jgi:hypothetical protein
MLKYNVTPEDPAFFKPVRRFSTGRWRYAILLISFLYFIIRFRSLFFLMAAGLIVMVLDYSLHISRFPLHIDPLLFITVIIAWSYSTKTAIIFAIITGNLPEILAGSFEVSDMISIVPIVLLSWLSIYLQPIGIIATGIIFSAVFSFIEFLIASALREAPHKIYIEPAIILGMNLFLFINFGESLLQIMS